MKNKKINQIKGKKYFPEIPQNVYLDQILYLIDEDLLM